jgi:adenosylcobinamide-phosphate synthase
MNRSYLLPTVYVLDQIAGDPEWFPHPVRWIGGAITWGESTLRRPGQSRRDELLRGAFLTTAIVISSYLLTRLAVQKAYRLSPVLGCLVEISLGWTCVAARSLDQESVAVLRALDLDDIELARRRLARIVGRDTEQLGAPEISRAVIETLAESSSDGVIAPVFYMTLGGVPLAMAYKAINTLDSMIGHADERYIHFGKAAARLDDVVNYLPARLTALITVLASAISEEGSRQGAWKTWLRDRSKHKSPNAGHPESAMAGAVGVCLGGGNFYGGEFVPAPPIGSEFAQPEPEAARSALRLVSIITLVGFGAGILAASLSKRGGPR